MRNTTIFILITTLLLSIASCDREPTLFHKLDPGTTGIEFSNRITETEQYNILAFEYIYNGGGVAIGDFDNDSLQDLFFSGNMVNNELYLNKGNFRFLNISGPAGIGGADRWCSGSAAVDINNDGWLDIYVCATSYEPAERRTNLLYVNQGLNQDGIPYFSEMAGEYGLADTTFSTAAAFFDYDNDGDLDLYVAVNRFDPSLAANAYWWDHDPRFAVNRDRLYESSFDSAAGHAVYRDVTDAAGILKGGFTLGINILDIDRDGWKDIYVSNDYNSPDMLFMNNGDGTFTDATRKYFKHICYSAMGMNSADMNNDGLTDIFVLDMLPEDNLRRKAMLQPYDYISYIHNEKFSYPYQHVRNMLQLNRGKRPDNGELIFSEVGFFAGVHATDWSWTPMIADFDHNQFRDLIVTNGFPKDITDHDFSDFMTMRRNFMTNEESLEIIPSVRLYNYAYRNELDSPGGIPHFSNVTKSWGISEPSFSNSAAYVDLDNDGDLDYVVNNIDDSASVYRNMLLEEGGDQNNWLKVSFIGGKENIHGLGAIIELYYGGRIQVWEHSPYRGYHSSVQMGAHFGLGDEIRLDSIRILWPDGKGQMLYDVHVDQVLTVNYQDAGSVNEPPPDELYTIFREISSDARVDFLHPEADYIDFNAQSMLLHKLSQYGPGIAVSDVNRDGLDDFYVGGSHFNKGRFFLQQADGTFSEVDLLPGPEGEEKRQEELGVLFFDADNDGDEDLYLVSGGYEFDIGDSSYQDRLFLNENGIFTLSEGALPKFLASGSCVKAADFDRDGDLDLFVGGRVRPFYYPLPVDSYILINNGMGSFRLGDNTIAPFLKEIGMISDALWTDADNDGWVDLLLAGEWAPLILIRNNAGKLTDTIQIGGKGAVGWWNSLASVDFDLDGDMDYVAGNLGRNSLIKTGAGSPVSIYAGDYDNDMRLDLIPTAYYLSESGDMREYPFFGRKDMEKQLREFSKLFHGHKEFGLATVDEVMSKLPDVTQLHLQANYQLTSVIENKGGGEFEVRELPAEAQLAPVFGMLTGDFTNDRLPDILLTGNDYGNEIGNGRYDALNGLLLQGDGSGNFKPLPMQYSGIIIPGDGKSLARLQVSDSEMVILCGQNRGKLGIFRNQYRYRSIPLETDDRTAIIHLRDGRSYREEVYYGDSYLSHSGRRIWIPRDDISHVEIISYHGDARTIQFTD